jgi:hypothetical protein
MVGWGWDEGAESALMDESGEADTAKPPFLVFGSPFSSTFAQGECSENPNIFVRFLC